MENSEWGTEWQGTGERERVKYWLPALHKTSVFSSSWDVDHLHLLASPKWGGVWWLNSVQWSKSQNKGAISRPKLIKRWCFPICQQGTDNNSAIGSSRKLITSQGYCLGLLSECEINFFVLEFICANMLSLHFGVYVLSAPWPSVAYPNKRPNHVGSCKLCKRFESYSNCNGKTLEAKEVIQFAAMQRMDRMKAGASGKMRRQPSGWEKITANEATDRGLIPKT